MGKERTQFKKGQSGNPGGRPKGFAARVRELVEPDEIIGFALEIARNPGAKDADRISAFNFLADRGWGKAQQFIEMSGEVENPTRGLNLSALPAERLAELTSILDEAAEATGADDGGEQPNS